MIFFVSIKNECIYYFGINFWQQLLIFNQKLFVYLMFSAMRRFRWNLLLMAVICCYVFKQQHFNIPRPLHSLSLIDLDVRDSKSYISFKKQLIVIQKLGVSICHHTKRTNNTLQYENRLIAVTGFEFIRFYISQVQVSTLLILAFCGKKKLWREKKGFD